MKYDVAVVGAGPAGAWVARCLARSGARVAIFDASHPREKPCGGGVTGRALALVGDAIDAGALAQTVVRSVRLRASSRRGDTVEPLTERDAVVALDGDALVVADRVI